MYLLFLLVLLVPLTIARAAGIEEIRIADMDETITMRANGTAEYFYRGRWNWNLTDERVGLLHAKLDSREFRRLAAIVATAHFGEMKDFYLPYSTSIVRTTVVNDGKEKTLERNDRGLAFDPEPPAELWTIEMAVRGLATCLRWEPIPSGVRVSLSGETDGELGVMVRELGTNYGVAALRTAKHEVEIPVAPGNYIVEVSELRNGKFEDRWKWWASVPPDKYVAVAGNSPPGSAEVKGPPRQELILATSNGWWLHCSADGSGIVGHGPAADDAAEFRAGTIDVATVRRELDKVTSSEPPMGYRFEVMYRDNGGLPTALHTKDSKVVLGVFTKAARKESSSRRGTGFDRFWVKHPPALKEP